MKRPAPAFGLLFAATLLTGCATPFPPVDPPPPLTNRLTSPRPLADDTAGIQPRARPPVVVNVQPVSASHLEVAQIDGPKSSLSPSPFSAAVPVPSPTEPPAAAPGETPAASLATPAAHPRQPAPTLRADSDPIRALIAAETTDNAPTEPPPDLWHRIRRGFALPNLEGDLVRSQEQWYASRPDYIERMTNRSRKYLFHVVEELERRNMPTELALLPFIESAFNPQAVSSAKAAGMWQFIPSTGRDFALKQNVFRDDRRDVLASTRAALNYLQRLHRMFGDWHLALAAYNWGEGNVSRAIAKNKRAGLGTAYTDLTMPLETQQYVPKLQAVKNIVADPDSLKVDLPAIENHPYFQQVDLPRDIDVKLAAELAQVPLADFKALNPSAHRPVIFASGTPHVLLPWDNAEVFRRNLQAHKAGNTASWTAWTAPSTMKVADAAKRVGMSEAQLREVNKIPPRFLIKSGSTLLVTRPSTVRTDVPSQVADNGQMALAPEVVLRRVVTKAGKKDTLASLAKRHQVTVANIAEWNKLATSASLKAGQSVVLFLPPAPRKAGPRASNPAAKKSVRSARSGQRTSATNANKPRMAGKPAPKRAAHKKA